MVGLTFWEQTGNMIDEEGAIGLSEMLKINTTIVKLDLDSELQANEGRKGNNLSDV